ncbi:hypothetical protein [Akkermansia sp.]|uniref:hypothetical protein n=1 Tax=Akkermansia sp. TaxID=1872421 RepID=UPI0025B7B754|nr:hypothetical protein [Akkermansia sp.]
MLPHKQEMRQNQPPPLKTSSAPARENPALPRPPQEASLPHTRQTTTSTPPARKRKISFGGWVSSSHSESLLPDLKQKNTAFSTTSAKRGFPQTRGNHQKTKSLQDRLQNTQSGQGIPSSGKIE